MSHKRHWVEEYRLEKFAKTIDHFGKRPGLKAFFFVRRHSIERASSCPPPTLESGPPVSSLATLCRVDRKLNRLHAFSTYSEVLFRTGAILPTDDQVQPSREIIVAVMIVSLQAILVLSFLSVARKPESELRGNSKPMNPGGVGDFSGDRFGIEIHGDNLAAVGHVKPPHQRRGNLIPRRRGWGFPSAGGRRDRQRGWERSQWLGRQTLQELQVLPLDFLQHRV